MENVPTRPLSDRHKQILYLTLVGVTSAGDQAGFLNIAQSTLLIHRRAIYHILGLKYDPKQPADDSRIIKAARKAVIDGLLPLPDGL